MSSGDRMIKSVTPVNRECTFLLRCHIVHGLFRCSNRWSVLRRYLFISHHGVSAAFARAIQFRHPTGRP